MKKIKSI